MFQQQKIKNEILNQVGHAHCREKETLFKVGDFGSLYYIIIKGEVFCLINPPYHSSKKD